MKTYSQKPVEVNRDWHLIDASTAPFGRIASLSASLLIGKHKPTVTSHVDGGDYVIITNSAKMVVTGDKAAKKIYYRHSGYPGGIYQRTMTEQNTLDPTAALRKAIRGMLPVNKLRDGRLARLKIYEGEDHGHTAQNPQPQKVKQ